MNVEKSIEKIKIQDLIEHIRFGTQLKYDIKDYIYSIETLLTAYEIKNFKIEEKNIYLQFGEITEKKRWKDKIKAKIEELKDGTYDAKIVLKSLLEKE